MHWPQQRRRIHPDGPLGRISAVDPDELRRLGITKEYLEELRDGYRAVARHEMGRRNEMAGPRAEYLDRLIEWLENNHGW